MRVIWVKYNYNFKIHLINLIDKIFTEKCLTSTSQMNASTLINSLFNYFILY